MGIVPRKTPVPTTEPTPLPDPLTIEGIRVVVDSGYARTPQFDPQSGLSRLTTVRISRASSEQRAGRAGRLAPGVCYRLWSETTQRGLVPFSAPEIRGADLAPLVLELAAWGVADVHTLRWLDPPPAAAFNQARELLVELDALDAAGFRVVRLDNRDIGLSQHFDHLGTPNLIWATIKQRLGFKQRAAYSLEDMARDAIGVLDALNIDSAHIVGASMGGMVAQVGGFTFDDSLETHLTRMSEELNRRSH